MLWSLWHTMIASFIIIYLLITPLRRYDFSATNYKQLFTPFWLGTYVPFMLLYCSKRPLIMLILCLILTYYVQCLCLNLYTLLPVYYCIDRKNESRSIHNFKCTKSIYSNGTVSLIVSSELLTALLEYIDLILQLPLFYSKN